MISPRSVGSEHQFGSWGGSGDCRSGVMARLRESVGCETIFPWTSRVKLGLVGRSRPGWTLPGGFFHRKVASAGSDRVFVLSEQSNSHFSSCASGGLSPCVDEQWRSSSLASQSCPFSNTPQPGGNSPRRSRPHSDLVATDWGPGTAASRTSRTPSRSTSSTRASGR